MPRVANCPAPGKECMDVATATVRQVGTDMAAYFDAIVGANISGFYQLYKLCGLDLNVRAFETGTSFGGA